MDTEKRRYQRYSIWFPVTIDDHGREVWGLCRDASSAGVLISSIARLEVGTEVRARFRVAPNSVPERTLDATVVRSDQSRDELILAFPYRIALQFRAPVPELVDELAIHADKTESPDSVKLG